ncbi:single-stranded DNA-binding protein [Chitinophaga polysaccharea]|uniref:single-stranded DNA-binding protein n=1 Tax=Chitinophaga TaxID=79328 RepID=UPI001455445D|nr:MULTISPECIES: single-stranded DNA-binding protein [Chitinophaga]NLR57072.1 single-stranded DNA-binding protein [Chitinophaga polysaccharea]NLU91803.1 single-stranded DNA-binding protein [Chitinophaga sp. Ak27]
MIKLQLIGHLGRDVVKKEVNGATVFNFPVAVNERFKNAQGILEERTTWVDCSLWDKGNVAPYLTQGVMVYVEGAPKVEAYISSNTGALSGALRLRVFSLQLLSRREEERRKAFTEVPVPEAEPVQEQPADDLPF